jgi:serine/threonine-protein kinase
VTVALFAVRPAATEQAGTIAFALSPPDPSTSISNPVLSPDGSFLLCVSDRIYIRRLSEFVAIPLPGTESAQSPFISPDGRWVGFFADGRIKRIAVAGGDPLDVCRTGSDSPGAGWGADNRIYFTRGWNDAGLVSVSANGGEVTAASSLDRTSRERGHWWPHALPDGRHVLFTIWYAAAGLSEARIGLLDLQTGKHRVFFPGATARYGAGHVLYYDAGAYKLVPFDLESLSTTGDSKVVLRDALGVPPAGTLASRVSLSTNGIVAYIAGRLYHDVELSWVGRDGRLEPTGVRTAIHEEADLSPDGRRIAFARPHGGTVQVVIADFGGGEQRLSAAGMNFEPVWHPDGQQVAFISMQKGNSTYSCNVPTVPRGRR